MKTYQLKTKLTKIRINKYLASIGIGSRRHCDKLIQKGAVKVNDIPAHMGMKIDPVHDKIELPGLKSQYPLIPDKHYIILYKPAGYITTMSDPQGRPTIKALMPDIGERIFPVGRLDFNSEGIILITNDGELAFKLTHPASNISKTYLVKVRGKPEQNLIKRLLDGIILEDRLTSVDSIKKIKSGSKSNSWYEVSIHEGRNRLIRKIFDKINHPVIKLKRINFAGIDIGMLKPGQLRYLKKKEIDLLKTQIVDKRF